MDIIATLAEELDLRPEAVAAAVQLIDEGNTIPFIARYRKEATGGMDDVALRTLDERLAYLRNLEQRKSDVITLIEAQGKLTPELEEQIRSATQLQRVEDLYKPYRKKRLTRAQKAREAGLEPLANMIFMQVAAKGSALDEAARFVTPEAAEKGFDTPEKALAGAADIVAEVVAEDAENVADLRDFTLATADIVSEAVDAGEKTPYEPYYDFAEPARKIPNHRVLAIDRGEREERFVERYEEEEKYNLTVLPDPGRSLTGGAFFYKPVNGVVTARYETDIRHYGVDLAAAPKESVLATLDGTVIYTGFDPDHGNVIQIQHKNGFISVYKHNESLLKRVGERVVAGEAIALVGNTGELSTGPHLHFELWYKGNPVNPEEYIAF